MLGILVLVGAGAFFVYRSFASGTPESGSTYKTIYCKNGSTNCSTSNNGGTRLLGEFNYGSVIKGGAIFQCGTGPLYRVLNPKNRAPISDWNCWNYQ